MANNETLLTTERRVNGLLWGSFAFLLVSGLIGWLWDTHNLFTQWLSIVHAFSGLPFALAVVAFGYIHFKRTLGFRRPFVLIVGLLAWLLLLGVAYTGLHILFLGRRESDLIIYELHFYGSFAVLAMMSLHLVAHYVLFPKRQGKRRTFQGLEQGPLRSSVLVIGSLVLLLAVLSSASSIYDPQYTSEPFTGHYDYSYGPHPFRPSHTETDGQKFIDTRQMANSGECAVCHQDIAQQWIDSTHKKAAADPTYVKNVNLLASNKGIAATRYCEGCHAPIALLSGALTEGGYHGGEPGTPANLEGVNCMSCHGVSKLEHLKGVASYRFTPNTPYVFEGSDIGLLRALNRLSIRLDPQQHKQDLANPVLAKPEFCATCHAQFMEKEMNDWGWVKMQDDYSAWLESPYSGQNPRYNTKEVVRCQDCHMPALAAEDPSADSSGQVRSHRVVGANTLLALMSGDATQYEETVRFLQANRVHITIEEPHRQDAPQNHFHLETGIRDQTNLPWYVYLNEEISLNVMVSNVGVGHNFPGGSIDINEAWIELIVTDASGRNIYESGKLLPSGEVDPQSHFYRSHPVDRHGKHVWKHDLFNMIGVSYRNVIPAGGSDVVTYQFKTPSWAVSPLTVSATVKYRKLNKRYTTWALNRDDVNLPVIDMARDQLDIPVRHQPEVHLSDR